jgi:hypothetical protein
MCESTYLVQCFLPLRDNDNRTFPREMYDAERRALTTKFGGLTEYTRAPAEGLWKDGATETMHDDLIVYEVMTRDLDREWWATYRTGLQRRFRQKRIVVRAHAMELL